MNPLDKNFEKLMKGQKLTSPSSRFSINVMDQIYQISNQIVYKPLINKWTWRAMFILIGLFVAYVFFHADPSAASGKWDLIGKLGSLFPDNGNSIQQVPATNILKSITEHFNQVPVVFSLSIIALSLLLLVDHLFLKRKKENL